MVLRLNLKRIMAMTLDLCERWRRGVHKLVLALPCDCML